MVAISRWEDHKRFRTFLDGVGYEYQILPEYQKYFGRLIIKFKNKSQNMIRLMPNLSLMIVKLFRFYLTHLTMTFSLVTTK